MKKILSLLFISILLISCKKDTKSLKENEVARISIETKKFEGFALSKQSVDSTIVRIEVPILMPSEDSIISTINNYIKAEVADIVSFDNIISATITYDSLVSSFLAEYTHFTKKFPDEDLPWKAIIQSKNTFKNDDLYAFTLEYYTFMGGAHGFRNQKGLIFDLKTGQLLDFNALVNNWSELQEIVIKQLPYYKELLNPEGILAYPEEIMISEEDVVFYYQSPSNFIMSKEADQIHLKKEEIEPFLNYSITNSK